MTNDGRSWAPAWSPDGDAIAFLHLDGQTSTCRRDGPARRRARRWPSDDDRAADRGSAASTARRAGPAWWAARAPRRRPTPSPPRPGAVRRRRDARPYLDRLARADAAATGTVLCVGIDPTPDALPAGWPAGPRRRRAVRPARRRGRRAVRRGRQAEPRLLRGLRQRRAGRPRAGPRGACPPDVLVVADAKRGDIGSTAARQAVALFDALGADAVTVSPYLGVEALAPLLGAAGPLRLRPLPDLEPGRRRAAGPARARRRRASARRPSRSTAASPGASRRPGLGGTGGPRRRRDRAGRARRASGDLAPGLAFLVPGVGAQGGDDRARCSADGPATAAPAGPRGRRRAARERLARHRRRPRPGTLRRGDPADPGERLAAAARELGAPRSLCYRSAGSARRAGAASGASSSHREVPARCRTSARSS